MSKILKSPAKYVQGPGVLREFDNYLQGMGKLEQSRKTGQKDKVF